VRAPAKRLRVIAGAQRKVDSLLARVDRLTDELEEAKGKNDALVEQMDALEKRVRTAGSGVKAPGATTAGGAGDDELRTAQVALVVTDLPLAPMYWAADPGAMALASRQLSEMIRSKLPKFKGVEVQLEGASFTLAFRNVIAAAMFSVDLQLSVDSHDWPESLRAATLNQKNQSGSGSGSSRGGRRFDSMMSTASTATTRMITKTKGRRM
jgi:hypothetical protein